MAMSEMGDFDVRPLGLASFANLLGWCGYEVQAGQPYCCFDNNFFYFNTNFPPTLFIYD